MTTHTDSTIIGVFRDRTLAEQASTELQRTGWTTNQLRLFGPRSAGFLAAIKNTFSEPATAPTDQYPTDLKNMDLPPEEHEMYQRELAGGSTLLVVPSHGRPLETRDLLNRFGAYHVFIPFEPDKGQVIPLRKEEAQVQKVWTHSGELRIHKKVITEQKTFTVPVTREEVTIERIPSQNPSQAPAHPVAQDLSQASLNSASPTLTPGQPISEAQTHVSNGQPVDYSSISETLTQAGTLRIVVHSEEVVVQKRPIIVEEIIITKQIHQETQPVIVPLKHEELQVEHLGNITVHDSENVSPSSQHP